MERKSQWLAAALIAMVVATACQPSPGPARSVFLVQVFEQEGLVPGEPTGLTVHFDPADQGRDGLPDSVELIANNSSGATANATMQAWVSRTEDEQPIPFGCFGPIEIRDERAQVLLTMTGFCDSLALRIIVTGDIRQGVGVQWSFDGPGDPVVEVPDRT